VTSTIIPCLSYRDADAMIEWLCTHLGFAANAVHHNDDGQVVHARNRLSGRDADARHGRRG
jgi:uncharacterized glyoxalase superfamily protein PhnB